MRQKLRNAARVLALLLAAVIVLAAKPAKAYIITEETCTDACFCPSGVIWRFPLRTIAPDSNVVKIYERPTSVVNLVGRDEESQRGHPNSNEPFETLPPSSVKHIVIDQHVLEITLTGSGDYGDLDKLCSGLTNLLDIEGIEYLCPCHLRPGLTVTNMRETFRNCSSLKEIDLSLLNTTGCLHFERMFDGCLSLERLKLGEGWTQEAARALEAEELGRPAATGEEPGEGAPDAGASTDGAEPDSGAQDVDDFDEDPDAWKQYRRTATFPTRMCRIAEDGTPLAWYEAGDVIPDGAGVYMKADERTFIGSAQLAVVSRGREGELEPGGALVCDYPDGANDLVLSLSYDGETLEDGVDYTAVLLDNINSDTIRVALTGLGDYYGKVTRTIRIADTGAYAFLYDDGLLVLKRDHKAPDPSYLTDDQACILSTRWFDAGTERPGESVPWSDMASSVQRVVIDPSFSTFAPVTSAGWFAGCSQLVSVSGLENIDTSRVEDMSGMFSGCAVLATIELPSGFGGECLASTRDMFRGCTMLSTVTGLEDLATPNVRDLSGMFGGCMSLASVRGLSNLNAPRAEDVSGMFYGCEALVELSLGRIGIAAGGDASDFARGCTRLERLELGDLDLSGAATTSDFLTSCGALKEISCGAGFRNATDPSVRILSPREFYRTAPSYQRLASGAAFPGGAGTYRLRDLALQLCTVEMANGVYTCTGKPLTPKMTVKLGSVTLREGTDYTIAYEHNVMPGRATATITGRGAFTGGLVVPFTIEARVTQVGDRLTYTDKSATYVLEVTKVTKKGRVAEVRIVSVKVRKGSLRKLALPSSCTVGGVTVSVTSVSSRLKGSFRNVTTIVIGSSVTRIGARAFAKATKVKTLAIKSARLKSVTNCLAGSKITKVDVKVTLSKAKRDKYKKWFTRSAGKSGVTVKF